MSLNMHKNQRNFFHQVDMERGDWDDRLSLTAYPFLEDDSLDGQSALTGIGSLDSFMQKSYQSETMKKILQVLYTIRIVSYIRLILIGAA